MMLRWRVTIWFYVQIVVAYDDISLVVVQNGFTKRPGLMVPSVSCPDGDI